MNIRHILAALLLAMCFFGCAMTEYGTHSLGTTPFEVPGLNSAEDGWRPAQRQSGDAYHGAERTTWARFQSVKRQNPDKRYQIDGYTCSCSQKCLLKGPKTFRTGGWGFGRTVGTAQRRGGNEAQAKCLEKSFKSKLGITYHGKPIGDPVCDEERQCLIHYTEAD